MSVPGWFELVGRRRALKLATVWVPLAEKDVSRFVEGSSGHGKMMTKLQKLKDELDYEMSLPLDHLRDNVVLHDHDKTAETPDENAEEGPDFARTEKE